LHKFTFGISLPLFVSFTGTQIKEKKWVNVCTTVTDNPEYSFKIHQYENTKSETTINKIQWKKKAE
jgi:hypothetical protein